MFLHISLNMCMPLCHHPINDSYYILYTNAEHTCLLWMHSIFFFSCLFAITDIQRACLILNHALLKEPTVDFSLLLICELFFNLSKSSPSFTSQLKYISSNLRTIFVCAVLLRKVIEDLDFIKLLISKSRSMRTEKCSLLDRQFLFPLFLFAWPFHLPSPHLKSRAEKEEDLKLVCFILQSILLPRWIGSRTGPNFKYFSN